MMKHSFKLIFRVLGSILNDSVLEKNIENDSKHGGSKTCSLGLIPPKALPHPLKPELIDPLEVKISNIEKNVPL